MKRPSALSVNTDAREQKAEVQTLNGSTGRPRRAGLFLSGQFQPPHEGADLQCHVRKSQHEPVQGCRRAPGQDKEIGRS